MQLSVNRYRAMLTVQTLFLLTGAEQCFICTDFLPYNTHWTTKIHTAVQKKMLILLLLAGTVLCWVQTEPYWLYRFPYTGTGCTQILGLKTVTEQNWMYTLFCFKEVQSYYGFLKNGKTKNQTDWTEPLTFTYGDRIVLAAHTLFLIIGAKE